MVNSHHGILFGHARNSSRWSRLLTLAIRLERGWPPLLWLLCQFSSWLFGLRRAEAPLLSSGSLPNPAASTTSWRSRKVPWVPFQCLCWWKWGILKWLLELLACAGLPSTSTVRLVLSFREMRETLHGGGFAFPSLSPFLDSYACTSCTKIALNDAWWIINGWCHTILRWPFVFNGLHSFLFFIFLFSNMLSPCLSLLAPAWWLFFFF